MSAPSATGARTDVPFGIEVRGLRKSFRDASGRVVHAVDNVDLQVPAGQMWVLLGPSGCGKTTLLRCLAGLERADEGTITMSGVRVFDSAAKRGAEPTRRVGMVFQDYALWPHMTVAENIRYPLASLPRSSRPSRNQIRERVAELLDIMRLGPLADRKISQLSGGQQQRVALARAIAVGNDVVLFDEPLSNIDAKVREQLRWELLAMQRELGFTAIYVTHDQAEALELADKIAVMRDGKIVQTGTGREIYQHPLTSYVADFVGTSNLIPGRLSTDGRTVKTDLGPVQVSVVSSAVTDEKVVVTSRAHDWWISRDGPQEPAGHAATENRWQGKVLTSSYLGTHVEYVVQVGSLRVRVWDDASTQELPHGTKVWVGVSPNACSAVEADHE